MTHPTFGPTSTGHGFVTRFVVLYLGLAAAILSWALIITRGHFSYSLDDPYIHLALAQQIAHFHYGINPGEAASPSSSILWPLLLAPFSHMAIAGWMPLALNLLSGLLACGILGSLLDRVFDEHAVQASSSAKWAIVFCLLVAANLIGLTFIGMEHTLQVALVLGCASGLMEAYAGRAIPRSTLLCAVLAPCIRYEDMAFTAAVVLVCWLQHRRRAAMLTLVASLLPLAAFSLFLHKLGLPLLPFSVLIKGGFADPHFGLLHRLPRLVVGNLTMYVYESSAHTIAFIAVVLAVLAWRQRAQATQRNVLAAASLAVGLVILLGPYGWFFRYEVCARIFGLVVLFCAAVSIARIPSWIAAGGLFLAASPYFVAIIETPLQQAHIYRQQYQMARFAHDYYRGNFAVNDLGWVSFNHPETTYVLDLFGLGSKESFLTPQAEKTPDWLDNVARRHNVGLVMIYPSWFGPVPASWTLLAELHENIRVYAGATASPVVDFYATPQANLPAMQEELHRFAATLPPATWLTMP